MAEKDKYSVIGVEIDGLPVADLWVKPGKEHADATSGSLMLGDVQVATTTWGWGRGYDRAYVGNWLTNQEAMYVKRGLHGHALDYACKKALEELHNDRLNNVTTTQTVTVPMTQPMAQQQTVLEIHSKICGNGAVAQVLVDGKYHEKVVDGVTQPQALLGAFVMGLRMATTNVLVLTSDMWIIQRWGKAVRPDRLEKYWNKVYQLAQGKNIRFQFIGKGGQPTTSQQPVSPKPIRPQQQEEEDIPPLDWEGILDYDSEEEVKPE